MLHPDQLTFHRRTDRLPSPPPCPADEHASAGGDAAIQLALTGDLQSLAQDWRRFQQRADCTPFQTFDWLATWQRHIGAPAGVKAAIVTGRRPNGDLLFIVPLAIERMRVGARLVFLGRALGDYNAPLLAPEFPDFVAPSGFASWWASIQGLVKRTEGYRHDLVVLDRMPEQVGQQVNPLVALTTRLNPSSAYMTRLGADWDSFYKAKRSSATRRRDRTKRKALSESGDLHIVTAHSPAEAQATLDILFGQKSRWFARLGIPNLFARPGHAEFFGAIAAQTAGFAHVSRLDTGSQCLAANLGLLFRGCYYHVLASYDDGPLARFGPGVVHLHELMRYAIEAGCDQFDFTIGDESYKRDWADTVIELYDHVAAASWLGRLPAAATDLALRAKRFIKQSPLLWSLAGWIRSWRSSGRPTKPREDAPRGGL
jgi:CelD/BcsL family acetyltransferase involved in cellulose biosynthesis